MIHILLLGIWCFAFKWLKKGLRFRKKKGDENWMSFRKSLNLSGPSPTTCVPYRIESLLSCDYVLSWRMYIRHIQCLFTHSALIKTFEGALNGSLWFVLCIVFLKIENFFCCYFFCFFRIHVPSQRILSQYLLTYFWTHKT